MKKQVKGAIAMAKAIFQVGPFECAGCAKKLENQIINESVLLLLRCSQISVRSESNLTNPR